MESFSALLRRSLREAHVRLILDIHPQSANCSKYLFYALALKIRSRFFMICRNKKAVNPSLETLLTKRETKGRKSKSQIMGHYFPLQNGSVLPSRSVISLINVRKWAANEPDRWRRRGYRRESEERAEEEGGRENRDFQPPFLLFAGVSNWDLCVN